MGRSGERTSVLDAVKDALNDRQREKGEAFVLDECNLKGRSAADVEKDLSEGDYSEHFKLGAADALYKIAKGGKQ